MSNKSSGKKVVDDQRSVSPVVATILVVAITIVIAASIGATVFGFTDSLGGTDIAASGDQCLQSVAFDPNDIDAFADSATADLDCQFWFDANQEDFSDGDSVEQWTDRSGNGFDATLPAVGNFEPPTYTSDDDGVAAIQFNSDEPNGLSTEQTAAEMGLDGDQEFTLAVVLKPNDGVDGGVLQAGTTENGGEPWGFKPVFDGGDPEWVHLMIGSGSVTWDGEGDQDEWLVVTKTFDGERVSTYIDGEPILVNNEGVGRNAGQFGEVGVDVTDTPYNIGFFDFDGGSPDDPFDGSIAEVVVLDESFEDTDRETLECAFDEKHGSAVDIVHCDR